jgi:hypothetical protein
MVNKLRWIKWKTKSELSGGGRGDILWRYIYIYREQEQIFFIQKIGKEETKK